MLDDEPLDAAARSMSELWRAPDPEETELSYQQRWSRGAKELGRMDDDTFHRVLQRLAVGSRVHRMMQLMRGSVGPSQDRETK